MKSFYVSSSSTSFRLTFNYYYSRRVLSTTISNQRRGRKRRKSHNNNTTRIPFLKQQQQGRILVLGDGDFSFSVALARQNHHHYITATSLDTYPQVCARYQKAQRNLQKLQNNPQVTIYHGFDATQISNNNNSKKKKKNQKQKQQQQQWNSIIWNFPYPTGLGTAGTHSAARCGQLVLNFFQSAKLCLFAKGHVYLTTLLRQQQQLDNNRKDNNNDGGSTNWEMERMANQAGLELVDCLPFSIENYPGYKPKRSFDDTTFPYYQHARTFVFGHASSSKKTKNSSVMMKLRREQQEQLETFYTNIQQLLQNKPHGIYVGVLRDVYQKEFPLDPFPDGMERVGVLLKRAADAGICQLEKRGPNQSSLWVTTTKTTAAAANSAMSVHERKSFTC